jgi:Cu(I)/Ag(I) efflux system membrane protein CusA/SilA
MPIQTRTDMLATGIRSPLGVKVFGPRIADIEAAGVAIERAVQADPRTAAHTRSAFAERLTGGFYLDVTVKREAAARYGLAVDDINLVVESAIGGADIGQTVEGRRRFPINLRYARDFREDPAALGRVLVTAPTGAQVRLDEVADLRFATGPMMLRTEGGSPMGLVSIDVVGTGVPDYVAAARQVVAEKVALPEGVRLEWAGQYAHFAQAEARLAIAVPATLLLVVILLFLNTGSFAETAIVLMAVPFSLIGAVWLLWLLHYKLSVTVVVGLIALAGLDAETGVVMLLYLNLAFDHARRSGRMNTGRDLEDAIVEGAARRLRPKLMTALTLLIGLMPVMWSDGTGADVMKRIAAPMVGGIVTSFLLELAVYPAVFAWWRRKAVGRTAG